MYLPLIFCVCYNEMKTAMLRGTGAMIGNEANTVRLYQETVIPLVPILVIAAIVILLIIITVVTVALIRVRRNRRKYQEELQRSQADRSDPAQAE